MIAQHAYSHGFHPMTFHHMNQGQWHTLIIPEFGKESQESKVMFAYIESLSPAGLHEHYLKKV